jgi:elongation factor 1 alpha-like protein
VSAADGEFETGFRDEGQTKEHAILARSLGVTQLIVAVNKLDTVQWSKQRFDFIRTEVSAFLKKIGYRETQFSFVPVSGLTGENISTQKEQKLTSWYSGPTLLDRIDAFTSPPREIEKSFRLSISDIYREVQQSSGVTICGRIESGFVSVGDRLLILPQSELCTVKGIKVSQGVPVDFATAGENVDIILTGVQINNIAVGNVLCDPEKPSPLSRLFTAQIITFTLPHPLTRGQPLLLYLHHLCEPIVLKNLISIVDKTTVEVKKKRPRCLTSNVTAVVEIQLEKEIPIELYKDYKQLGRFTLREGWTTVAAGIVTEIGSTASPSNVTTPTNAATSNALSSSHLTPPASNDQTSISQKLK